MQSDASTPLSETTAYALLSHRRRRLLLRLMQEFSSPLTAREVAALIANCTYEDPPEDRIRVVHISLHHTHLPKLDDADVVAYDQDSGAIEPGSNFGVLIGALEEGERGRSLVSP
ncbi:hypothetical protein OB905_12980 [Halobacteria archaeon AArc-dxtr1]|nr:hypothetical protein [Halobacteria archaeon AArc-dxtr1]